MKHETWTNKISNPAQLGGVETAVVDNGAGRGTRIAWINTGTGLRYKVVIDRAMDIADAFYNHHSLAWISHLGITPPQPFSHRGTDWLKTFGGGLLTTCGLTHIGPPETDQYGERGLHGPISNTPAEVESIIQPDPFTGRFDMSITGRVKQAQIFGPNLELKRTISGTLGEASIRIEDEVVNLGNTTVPHMILYHFNFGWPLADEGTDIIWDGKWQTREDDFENKIFKAGNHFRKCPAPLDQHNGGGEEVAFIDPTTDQSGHYTCGLSNSRLGLAVRLRFRKSQLPWLTNWQHWGKGEYVTGLEPGTNPPIGQAKARETMALVRIEPGARLKYNLELDLLDNEIEIGKFLKTQSTLITN